MMLKSVVSVAKGKKPKNLPIWFMRQAGRYLPEYKKVRSQNPDFIKFILNSEAAAEVTLQPLKRFDINAAIIFSDILLVPYAMGVDVKFVEGIGPVIKPVTDEINNSIDREKEVYSYVNKSISLVSQEINKKQDVTLIGFAGSPWTVMSYLIEGNISKNFQKVRSFFLTNRAIWNNILEKLINSTILYLSGQIEAGAEVIQLFDSWAGAVPEADFEDLIINPTKKIVSALKEKYPDIPIIGFPRGSGIMSRIYADKTGIDVLAIDQNIPIDWAKDKLQTNIALQGNMDNMILAYSKNRIEDEVKKIVKGLDKNKLIFNLGHGILPSTSVENVAYTIEKVRKYEG